VQTLKATSVTIRRVHGKVEHEVSNEWWELHGDDEYFDATSKGKFDLLRYIRHNCFREESKRVTLLLFN
jgi:hypothetical protein